MGVSDSSMKIAALDGLSESNTIQDYMVLPSFLLGYSLLASPLQVIQTRMQATLAVEHLSTGGLFSNTFQRSGLVTCFTNITKEQGIRGFYKGFVPFTTITMIESLALSSVAPKNATQMQLIAAGTAITFFYFPLLHFRTVSILAPNIGVENNCKSIFRAVSSKSALFSGIFAYTLFSQGDAISNLFYEIGKPEFSDDIGGDENFDKSLEFFKKAAIVMPIVYMTCYPLQTVSVYQQIYGVHNKPENIISVVKRIYQTRGICGFYAGLSADILKIFPLSLTVAGAVGIIINSESK